MNTDGHGCGPAWEAITGSIIGCAYQVSNTLGAGFLEKVYENALAHELRKAGLKVAQQFPIRIRYDGVVVGKYDPDLLVEDTVIVELLTNFSTPRVQVKRILNPAVPQAWIHPADDFDDD